MVKPIIKLVGATLIGLASLYGLIHYSDGVTINIGPKYSPKELEFKQSKEKYEKAFKYLYDENISMQSKLDSLENIVMQVPPMNEKEAKEALIKVSTQESNKNFANYVVYGVLFLTYIGSAYAIHNAYRKMRPKKEKVQTD